MNFDTWKSQLAIELEKVFQLESGGGAKYVAGVVDTYWHKMFDEGWSPAETASHEICTAILATS